MLYIPEEYKLNSYEIIMTWDCNLRCVYCYECQAGKTTTELRKTNKTPLTSERINEIVDFIVETHDKNARNLTIVFWGGEPLLAFEQIKEFIAKLELAGQTGRIKKPFNYATTTNLTLLTLDQVRYLQSKKFHILVSFDGLPEITDRNRGAGTFVKVVKNMALLEGLRLPFAIRMTVPLGQIDTLKKNLNFVDSLRHRFWWCLDCTQEQLTQANAEKLLDIVLQFYQERPNNRAETLKRYLRPKRKNYCIDPYQQITIDPEGGLRVCSRVDYIIGNIQEGITKYDEIKDWPFYSGRPLETCASCLVYEKCHGGCLGEHAEKNKELKADYRLNAAACREMMFLQLLNENLVLKQQYAELKKEEEELCHIPTI